MIAESEACSFKIRNWNVCWALLQQKLFDSHWLYYQGDFKNECFNTYFFLFLSILTKIYITISDFTSHSSFEREKTVNEFLLGLWTCFWDYGWLLSWPRWKFFPWKYSNQVALRSFFQKVVEIKIRHHFEYKKTFCYP